jgi:hypothetical protein
MSLADKLTGLSRHKIDLPPPPQEPVAVFDRKKADQLLRSINDSLGIEYPAGCLEWLSVNRPDIWKALCEGENAVNAAYLAENLPEMEKAGDLLQRMYCKAYEVFNTRPPVIEVQADLGLT